MKIRSLFRFRIRTLLVVVALAALALAPLGQARREFQKEQAALRQLMGDLTTLDTVVEEFPPVWTFT